MTSLSKKGYIEKLDDKVNKYNNTYHSTIKMKLIDARSKSTKRLSNLKSKIDKLDIGKLETTPVDLSNLSNVVKYDFVKKTEYNKLVKKVNDISTTDTSNLVKKTGCNTKVK